jgi:hypothetical protein
MRRLLHYADKLALVVCLLLFLASAVWATMSFRRLDEIAELNPTLGVAPARHTPAELQMPDIARVYWPEPTNQSRGPDWLYDVFTPPVLYYDPITREFTVTRPELGVAAATTVETPFEVELVSVRQEPYRIQLVGYARNDAEFLAQFEIVELGAVVLGRAGAVYPENKGHFTVRSFDVRRVTTSSDESMPVVESIGVATILDGRIGREVTLTTRERLMLPRLQCVLRTRAYPPEEHALREGMKITVNGYDYLIQQLSLNPAQAVVSRRPSNSLGDAERRTLVPVGGTAAAPGSGHHDNSIDSLQVSLFPRDPLKLLVDPVRQYSR